jgi:hypothetical protein
MSITEQRDARVVGLFVAPVAGTAIESRAEATLVAGVGVEGDRYATRLGYWSDPRWPDQELTFVEAEVAEALGVEHGALRRNVVTRGVRLETLIDVRFVLGDALIEGVRACDPCAHIEEITGRPGLLKALAGRGGLRARIVRGGRVCVGDAITVEQTAPAS